MGQNGEIRRGGEGVFREKRRRIFKFRRFLIQQIFRKFITNAHMGNIFFSNVTHMQQTGGMLITGFLAGGMHLFVTLRIFKCGASSSC